MSWFLLLPVFLASLNPALAAISPQAYEKCDAGSLRLEGTLSCDNLPVLPEENQEAAWLFDLDENNKAEEPKLIETALQSPSEDGGAAALSFSGTSAGKAPEIHEEAEAIDNEKLAAANPNGAAASAETALAVEELTRRILLKEVALEKFNLNYKLNAAKQGRWKGLRYAAFGETNAALGLAGGIASVYNRGWHVNRASAVRLDLQKRANTVPMIGNIIGAGAAALEFGINGVHEYEAWKKGFSPGLARKHVAGLKNEIAVLTSKRDELVQLEKANPAFLPQAQLHELEGNVLQDLRDQALLEFQRYHLGARRQLAFQQMQYFLDFASNTTGAIGFNFAYLSLHRGRRVWNYRAGVMFTVSGALTMGGPIVSRLFGKALSEYHRGKLKETLNDAENKEVAKLAADKDALERFVKSGQVHPDLVQDVLSRCDCYSLTSKRFEDQVQSASKQLARARLIATENVGAGLYTGGSRVAGGVLFIIPGYLQLYNRSTETAGRITNSLLLTSGIIGLPASGFRIFDTLRIQARGEMDRARLARQGKLPADLIAARLKELDLTESRLLSKSQGSR